MQTWMIIALAVEAVLIIAALGFLYYFARKEGIKSALLQIHEISDKKLAESADRERDIISEFADLRSELRASRAGHSGNPEAKTPEGDKPAL